MAQNNSVSPKQVRVSVGIPAYNEEKTIAQLLNAILNQPMKEILLKEIIVDVSGSTDSTEAKVIEIAQVDSRVKLISKKERSGKASALNAILQRATGDVVLFIDGDVILGKDSISILIRPLLHDKKIGISSGNVMPIEGEGGIFTFASHFVRELHHELCCYLISRGLVPKVDGTFYAIRKKILKRFPLYVISDDEYASWRAQSKGYKIVYTPEAVVYTEDPSSLQDIIEWQRRIMVGQLYIKKHFGYSVPTMKASVILPSFIKLIKKHRKRIPHILTLIFLGGLSYLLALIMLLRNEIPYAY
ncbi:MAG: glycosyltransferase [Candidatus Bathyarchaeia archaeon]